MSDISADLFSTESNFSKFKNVNSKLIFGKQHQHNVIISVVIPTYNRADLLKISIESVLHQNYDLDYEIVVVDNNPERDCATEQLIFSMNNEKIKYYKNEKNIGMTGNWNRCYELANGNWVVMLHDDDYLLNNYFKEIKKLLIKKYDLINISYLKWDEKKQKHPLEPFQSNKNGYIFKYSPFDFLFGFLTGAPLGMVIRKEFMLKVGGFSEDFYPSIDYAFMVKASNYGRVIKLFDKELAVYRYSVNETLNIDNLEKFIKIDNSIKNKIMEKLNIPQFLKKIFRKSFDNYAVKYVENAEIDFNYDASFIKNTFNTGSFLEKFQVKILDNVYKYICTNRKILYYAMHNYLILRKNIHN